MIREELPTENYDGFGPPILDRWVLSNVFVHENGAWRWRRVGKLRGMWGKPSHVREALSHEDLVALRDMLRRSLAVIEAQIERTEKP